MRRLISRGRLLLRSMFRRRRVEEELDEELQFHLQYEIDRRMQAGVPAAEARLAALRAMGAITQNTEECRSMRGLDLVDHLMQDIRYALRGLRKSPTVTAVAVLSLALGIGATTAVFSVLNAVALRPLPVADPGRLVQIQPQLRGKRFPLFNPLFEEMRANQQSLSGMLAVSDEPYLKAGFEHTEPTYVRGSLVSGNYFQILGLSPALGRLFTEADDEPAAGCAAVLSHAFWTSTLRGDPAVPGRKVTLREKV